MGKAVEKCRGHLGVTEDSGPFAEAEVGGDDDAGALVEFVQQMEQERPARGAERQISQFVQVDEDQKTIWGIVFLRRGGQAWSCLRRSARPCPWPFPVRGC